MAIHSAFWIRKAGYDRFSVSIGKESGLVIGYVASNHDSTWSVEYEGEKLPRKYHSINDAATALVAMRT